MYNNRGSRGRGATKIGGDARYFLRSLNLASASGVQSTGPDFFSSLRNGSALSARREMNLPSVVMQPFSLWTSLMRLGACIFSIALILSELTLMPRWDTKDPRSLLE